MRQPDKRTTLVDVAREAGVSVQTASHVMTGNMTVRLPEATRERVRAAAAAVGYRPNRMAQAMKAGKTQLIGVWIPLDRPVLHYLHALQHFNRCAKANGYDLLISGIDGSLAYAGEGKAPFSWPIDGLIAYDAGKAAAHFRNDSGNNSVPLIVVGLEEYSNSDSVAWGVWQGTKEVTQRLISQGRNHIVFLTPAWVFNEYPREQRRRGYTEAMEESGRKPVFLVADDESPDAAGRACLDHLSSGGKVDAIVCFLDPMALGALRVLAGRGIRVPDDCTVWGYGDTTETAMAEFPISTLRIPTEAIAERSWQFLTERIADPSLPGRVDVLPMQLIERT